MVLAALLALANRSIARPYTVRDSIEWTQLIPFAPTAQVTTPEDVALFAPDRRHFILHGRRGDLASGTNIDTLYLFETNAVDRYWAGSHGLPPNPVTVFSATSTTDETAPSGIRWVSNSAIELVARSPSGHTQAYSVDIGGGSRNLTDDTSDVVAFSTSGDRIIYYTCVAEPNRPALAVSVHTFSDVMPPPPIGCYLASPLATYVGTTGSGSFLRAEIPTERLGPDARGIWLSPSGKYAVVLATAVNAPESWEKYELPGSERWGFGPQWRRSDAASMDLINRYRYELIDVNTGAARPLLDAPSGIISFNLTPPAVFWTRDEHAVIVSNTFLPLTGVDGGELAHRERTPAIAQVNVRTGETETIAWEPVPGKLQEIARTPTSMIAFDWDADRERLTVVERALADPSLRRRIFEKDVDKWREVGTAPTNRGSYVVETRESLNERPMVFIRGAKLDKSGVPTRLKRLFDPNPQADELEFGKAQVVTWADNNGLKWNGGLLLPSARDSTSKPPLIIQTHGFEPNRFLLDGPFYDVTGATSYSARSLAAAGFAVLQVEDNRSAMSLDEHEGDLMADGFRAGFESLDRRRLIDPRRVGLIAFSRTGLGALALMARHPKLLSAVDLSDALLIGYSSYNYNIGSSSADDLAKLTGGDPNTSPARWFSRNPFYSLTKQDAAVRLEEMGSGLGMWEAYAVLSDAQRPVDFVVYPDGSHVLQKPAERWTSQQGNVDWFRFWLQGYERKQPVLVAGETTENLRKQYVGWEKLCEQQKVANRSMSPICAHDP
jgi:hypothetical protein